MTRFRTPLLALILATNLSASLIGIDWGLPYSWHTDEKTGTAVDMISRRSLDPQYFINPHLHIYVLYGVVRIAQAVFPGQDIAFDFGRVVATTNPDHPDRPLQFWVMRMTRGLSALFAVATVFLIYRIGRKHFGEATGLLAAAFLAVTMGFVELAHYATVESMLFFLVVLVLASFDNIQVHGRPRDYVLTGVLIGLAFGTKYTIYLLGFPLLAAHVYRHGWRAGLSLRGVGMMAITVLVAVVVFFATTPYALITWKEFWETAVEYNKYTAVNFSRYVGTILLAERSYLPFLDWLVNIFGFPLFMLCLVSLIATVVWLIEGRGTPVERRAWLVHATWILVFYFITGFASIHALRYIMPLVPSAVLLAAMFSVAIVRYAASSRRARLAAQIVIGGILAYCVAYTARADWMFLNDTRYTAGRWLSNHLVRPTDEVHFFALDSYIPYIDRPHYRVRFIPFVQTPQPPVSTPNLRSTFWEEADSYMSHSQAVIADTSFYWDRYIFFPWRWPDHDIFYRRLLAGLDPSGYKPVVRFVWKNPWWLNPRPERISPEVAIFAKPGTIATLKTETTQQ